MNYPANNNARLLYKILPFLVLSIFAYIMTILSVFIIKNPDFNAYYTLAESLKEGASSSIEPTFILISSFANKISEIVEINSIYIIYYIYIYSMSIFLYLAINRIGNGLLFTFLVFIAWYATYGLMHGLVQIRFGLANIIFLYLFILLNYSKNHAFKVYLLSFFGGLTHYSTIFSYLSVIFIYVSKNKHNFFMIHFVFISVLVSLKMGGLFNIIPNAIMVRLSVYLSSAEELGSVPLSLSLISLVCYFLLIFSPSLKLDQLNNLKYYGALSFLPYFIVPEYEILIRLGVSFQYLLLPYLFLTFRIKKAIPTTLLLLSFFCYKMYSSLSAFLGYL